MIFAWVGLLFTAAALLMTLYDWIIRLWERILYNVSHPKGLWLATKMCVQLKLTKDKTAHVAQLVVETLEQAKAESPEFERALSDYYRYSQTSASFFND